MAGRIRESDIAAVRDRNRIDDIVGEYVSLRRAGGGALKGLCPFHDEKTPSFNVRSTHGTFHCFGCGEGGDVIAFLMKIDHLSFVEAVERLAERSGIQLTYEGGAPTRQRDKGTRTRLVDAHRAAAEFYAEQLATPDAVKAREFLAERGFDQAAAVQFGCGYAPAGWDKLTKHLLGRGFDMQELIKGGLSREGRQGPIDRFHRRLLWPIKDLGGDVVGFGARRLYDDDQIQAKYLNTSESPIYKKSQVLFGLDLAKREIARRHQVVVVEGYTDVMAMHLAGVLTSVASCGTAFGSEHITVLRRLLMDDDAFRGEVIYTFDGDEAGQKAALKAFDEDQKFAAQTFIAIAPDGQDPCELRQTKGDVAVRDLVARRRPLFEFAIKSELASHNLDNAEGRVEALRRTVPMVSRIKEMALRDEYARQLAGWVGWEDTATVVRRVRETSGGAQAPARRAARPVDPGQGALAVDVDGPPRPNPRDPQLHVQREVIKLALQEPAFAGPMYDQLPQEVFTHPAYAELHRAVLGAGGTASGLGGADLIDAVVKCCESGVGRALVTELAVEAIPTRQNMIERYAAGMLAALQRQLLAGQIADIKSRLQRLSPIEEPDEARALWGDLVALEQYYKALGEQAAGGMG
ncbi:DNA primase [Actinophytocola algeriensis]|uniref:DNA primase n=1 Tax=Actinophytocola algeriensis TaxID=1768010 RepID=A0A7W7VFQ0_9PSEU|nr:DNA primase [Actinophytocola algeriensis]MBB4908220.1 DNA primase [Actinophytocola algeriensis]MBE1480250.1 DNA primase [Actinophytocola algeriensis]